MRTSATIVRCPDESGQHSALLAGHLQGLATLRPQLVGTLLRHCHSIKAKRLFLALAERHHHAWLPHVDLQGVDLGRGKRVLVPGGKLNATSLSAWQCSQRTRRNRVIPSRANPQGVARDAQILRHGELAVQV